MMSDLDTLFNWLFSFTQLIYFTRIVVITAITPDSVQLSNGETRFEIGIAEAMKQLKPKESGYPLKHYQPS